MTKLEKNKYFYLLVAIYFTTAVMAILFDIGHNELLMHIVDTIEMFIPTVSSTAAITPNPSAAKLILTLSWLMIIPVYFSKLIVVNWNEIKWGNASKFCNEKIGINNMNYVNAIFIIVMAVFLYAAIYLPITKGHTSHRRLVYELFCNYTGFVSVYGMCLVLIFSHLLLIITIISFGVINKKF